MTDRIEGPDPEAEPAARAPVEAPESNAVLQAPATAAARDGPWSVPWHVNDALAVLGITVLVTVGLAVALAVVSSASEVAGTLRVVLLPLPLAVLGLVTIAWVHGRYGSVRPLFGPAAGEARDWIRGMGWGVTGFFSINIGLGLIVQALARAAGVELPQPQEQLRQFAGDPAVVPWLLATALVVAPVSEELFFRGMLFQSLRQRMRAGWGIVLSAAIFAGAHVLAEATGLAGLLVFFLVLPLGVLFGWLLERHGTLVSPIAAHSTFNLLTSLVLIAGRSGLMS